MKPTDPENLLELFMLLEYAIADSADDQVTIPRSAVDAIMAALLALPGRAGRPRLWSKSIAHRVESGLRDGTPINSIAREISALNGQPFLSVRRRVQEVKKERRLKELKRKKVALAPNHSR